MPASRPTTTKRIDTRLRVNFDSDERSLLAGAAGPDGLAQAAFVRKATLETILRNGGASPPTAPATQKRNRRTRAYFSAAEEAAIAAKAKAQGLTVAEFQRMAALTYAGIPAKPKKKKVRNDDLLHGLSQNTFQLRGLGRNFNQLVKKANEGAVPITRGEIQYFANLFQVAISKNISTVEAIAA